VLGFVLADHRESLAAAQAHRMQAQRELAHIGQHVVEGELAPDAAVLVTLGDAAGIGAGPFHQVLGQGLHREHQRSPPPR
jgi:hypothetical protein